MAKEYQCSYRTTVRLIIGKPLAFQVPLQEHLEGDRGIHSAQLPTLYLVQYNNISGCKKIKKLNYKKKQRFLIKKTNI